MKKSIFFSVLAISLCLASCKAPLTYSSRTARSEVMPVSTWATWTTADLKVDEMKVSLTVNAPTDNKIMITEDKLKENAIGELLEKFKADVLINPLYRCDYQDGKLVSVTVTGYPARHTNFRNISFEEQTKYMIEKEKVANAPQIVINGGEIINEVAAPAPCTAPAPAAAPAQQPKAQPKAAAPAQTPAPASTYKSYKSKK